MKRALCQALLDLCADPDFIFLTGDLGYNALEPLRDALGDRFVNAGVAEQNMVGVAAGLARAGYRPWAYSIAPFLYARAYEQIRNDVCGQHLPVKFVGNGGGYGYGAQGGTHHALEDYGALLCLQGMRAFVPAFADDVGPAVRQLHRLPNPAYLRLGLSEAPRDYVVPAYAPWRRLFGGGGPIVLAVGPIAGTLIEPLSQLDEPSRPSLWVLAELPLDDVPEQFLADLRRAGHLLVVEEHVVQGGAGQMLAHWLLARGLAPRRFSHRAALGYVSGLYGSQKYHRRECGLDPASVLAAVLGAADLPAQK